jgi:hypothetical protein
MTLSFEEIFASNQNGRVKKQADRKETVLERQAYHRAEWDTPLRNRCVAWLALDKGPDRDLVTRVYEWFLCPVTMWPCRLSSLLSQMLDLVEKGRPVSAEMRLLVEVLPDLPNAKAVETFVTHEHDVQAGRYEHLVPAVRAKFNATEKELAANRAFRTDWRKLSSSFDIARYADHKGVVRRTLVSERNMRGPSSLDWGDMSARFQAVFDAFCAKWNLYGMQNGQPLLLKLSVNLTPYGTMIFVPAYWSFDPKRDVSWGEVSKLHRSRGQHRQGATLAENAEQRRKDAAKLAKLDLQAKTQALRGAKRHEFLCRGLNWDVRTDPKRLAGLRRLLSEAKTANP